MSNTDQWPNWTKAFLRRAHVTNDPQGDLAGIAQSGRRISARTCPDALLQLARLTYPMREPEQVLGRAGDLLLAHYLLGHDMGGNLSSVVSPVTVRAAVCPVGQSLSLTHRGPSRLLFCSVS